MSHPASLYTRYLRLLGITDLPSGLEGLREIVRRHLFRVPFENISKLLLLSREGAGRPFTFDEFLNGIEFHDLGGTCHSCNPFLADLLRHLGYHADLLGADMTVPNCHTCIRVRVDGISYHVDVGYGGPFREPMRLDRLPHEFSEGKLGYRFDRNGQPDRCEMQVLSGAERVHGYVVHGPPRQAAFFEPAIRESFAPARTFVSHLRIVRTFETHSAELFDRRLSVNRDGETTQTTIRDLAELKSVVATTLALPRCPIEPALEVLASQTGADFFANP